jgi:outer membrane protein assembly factor BamB
VRVIIVRVHGIHGLRAPAVRRVRWRPLGSMVLVAAVTVAAVAGVREIRGGAGNRVDHTTSRTPPPLLTAAGPPPGPVLPVWSAATDDLAGQPPPVGQVAYGIVSGQVIVASGRGLDVLDSRTGRPRWHLYREGWTLDGWAGTGSELAAYFEWSGDSATHLLISLDAATGAELWQSGTAAPAGVEQYSLRWPAAAAAFLATRDTRTLEALASRTGRVLWTRALPRGCTLAGPAPFGSGGDDAVALLPGSCAGQQRVIAYDPADGRIRWSVPAASTAGATVIVRQGISAIWDGSVLRVLDALGRPLLLQPGGNTCDQVCFIAVAAGHVLVNYSPDGMTQLLRAVDTGTGAPAWSRPAAAYQAVTDAGGRVYALRSVLADGLLPAALDVVNPADGQMMTTALPLSFEPGATDQPWLAAAGGLLFAGYPLAFAGPAGGARVVALRSAPPGAGPAELGGVPPAAWPDACSLLDDASITSVVSALPYDRQPEPAPVAGLHSAAACRYVPQEADPDAGTDAIVISVGWVAASPAQAAGLLADVRFTYQAVQRLPYIGDEAYDLGGPGGPVAVRVGRVIVLVQASQDLGATTQLARAAALKLRQGG